MSPNTPKLIWLLLFFALPFVGKSQILLNSTGQQAIEGKMKYFRDETKGMSLDQVIPLSMKPIDSDASPNLGFDRAAHWFSFEIENKTDKRNWLLEVAFAPLDHVDFFIESDSGNGWTHLIAGDTIPISKRELRHRHPIFNFSIDPGRKKTIYLRTQTISSVQMPVVIWQRDVFYQSNYHLQLLNGLFYGAMLTMALYQLFLFFSIRDRATFFYVVALFTMVNVVSFYQGYTFVYGHPEWPEINDWFAMINGPLFVASSSLLTRSFLNLRKYSRWLDNAILINMSGNILVAILMMIFYRQISYGYHHFFVLTHCVIVLSASAYCLYKKFLPARYYLLAWVTPLIGAGGFTASNLGLAPGFLGTNYFILEVGCILQMLFISFALGDKFNALVNENEKARQQELSREKSEKERLELIVQQRTEEISHKNSKLEEVNRIKDKLFSVVSHDIKGPLATLQQVLRLVKIKKLDADEFKQVSGELEVQLDKTNEFIDNLLQWAKLQLRGETFEPTRLIVRDVVTETLELMQLEANKKSITIISDLPENGVVVADLNMIRTVLRNLLMNAVKFTPMNGAVRISGQIVDHKVIVSVSDTGVGIPGRNLERLFTMRSVTTLGTHQEKGTGLGLLLCREFIEKNGGTIWVESEENRGTTFSFSLPVAE